MHVIIKSSCLEDQGRHKDRVSVINSVLLCLFKLILGNRYVRCVALFNVPILGNQCTVPGFPHERAKGSRTHDSE